MEQGTALVEALAVRFHAARAAVADAMLERIQAGVPELAEFDGPELWEAVRESCLANLEVGLRDMARGTAAPEALPAPARELALLTARLDLPLAGLLRTYRAAHAIMWERWFAAVVDEPVDREIRQVAVEQGSRFFFGYVDGLCTLVTDEYTAERDRFMRSREQRRTQLVRDVLDGADPDPAEAMRELDYDLRLEHLALVVSGPDPEAGVLALGRLLDAPHSLVVSLAGDSAWGWLGRTRRFEVPERIEAEGARISLGDPARGIEGFRRSHREAREAHRVGRGPAGVVVRYDDVALEALFAGDRDRTRAFVERELHGLDGADARSVRLRATLRAYFATGQNASAAAAMLGVHEHTVAYRLRTIEERLGRPVTARRAELETALRLLEAQRGGG